MLHQPHPSSDEIFISITFYRRIVYCTEAIEDAISMCSFFLYGAIITWMLNSFNVITVQETVYHNRLTYIFCWDSDQHGICSVRHVDCQCFKCHPRR
ncbi:hypothetical protein CEXT_422961 [Caerostris extrusa]|uniref:Uncharacterized protein n=1 Tax=Caerostris extrusa TaxID=172846 RepID=A0AAV4MM20_CAEEX|nr:hypothetical protein CEXT_422961 [Caerostris extrusa]